MPSYRIFKGKRNKNEFGDGTFPVSYRTMNKTSEYVTTVLFMPGLNNYFIPKKKSGIFICILIGANHIVQTLIFSNSTQKRCPKAVSQNALFAASR
jgi:hypothetical protein